MAFGQPYGRASPRKRSQHRGRFLTEPLSTCFLLYLKLNYLNFSVTYANKFLFLIKSNLFLPQP